MNKIDKLFESKKKGVLNVYFTAGYPNLDDTVSVLESLQEAGADMIEIGMPYSDPVADGPTIQASNDKALANGMTIPKLLEQLKGFRERVHIPVVMMGYVNPVMQYGIERFCAACEELGIDGLILPDLPMQVYRDEYKDLMESHKLHNIFLITPQTTNERIKEIDENSSGFIYVVSDASITGAKKGISEEQISYFKRLNDMKLEQPTLIGFGISDHETFSTACEYANGAIIGSAFIKALSQEGEIKTNTSNFVTGVLKGE
ncbi:tryptophan synthase subunit alpha [Sediminitomix flava]|uniref:Tryptophan synthase alpha chain n=1 Tax=Sediminitomix flava TaxID=379075 RepID=A0A315Z7Y5_SEDFL|nr:tryptophan synthase subunit alpha [Sediminitomix flava]PWJ40856.1 tryptophan synthase alpha chain [Sediminitomix flava]